MARAGEDLQGVVSFHGGLKTPPGQDYADCLEANGIDAAGVRFTINGRGANGGRIIVGIRGPQVDAHADVTGGMRGEVSGACVEVDECSWYNPFCSEENRHCWRVVNLVLEIIKVVLLLPVNSVLERLYDVVLVTQLLE